MEFQLKALEIQEKVLDKNHPSLANSYNNLALIYLAMKDYESASKYCEKAVAIMEKAFPDGHPDLDVIKRNLEEIKKGVKG
jgi:tetratricopeptide (TPR) repeat protein